MNQRFVLSGVLLVVAIWQTILLSTSGSLTAERRGIVKSLNLANDPLGWRAVVGESPTDAENRRVRLEVVVENQSFNVRCIKASELCRRVGNPWREIELRYVPSGQQQDAVVMGAIVDGEPIKFSRDPVISFRNDRMLRVLFVIALYLMSAIVLINGRSGNHPNRSKGSKK